MNYMVIDDKISLNRGQTDCAFITFIFAVIGIGLVLWIG